jgi:hypothetical protein
MKKSLKISSIFLELGKNQIKKQLREKKSVRYLENKKLENILLYPLRKELEN